MNSLDRTVAHPQLSTFAWTMSGMIGLLLCFVQLGIMASLLAHRVGFAEVLPIAVVLSILSGYVLQRNRASSLQGWMAAGLFLFLLGVSLALSAFFFDFSMDGQWYHQAAIIHIGQEWNPLTDPLNVLVRSVRLWDQSYSKGPWYFDAAVWKTTDHIELGKAINWLALSACFFAVLGASLDGGLRRSDALFISLIVAINPVVMSEATSFMVDSVMFSFLVVAAASLLTCLHRPSAAAMIAGIAGAIVTTNAKQTGLVYLCFALAAGGVWCLVWRRTLLVKFALTSVGALFLAVCVWGYNPYLTNTYNRHQPFYPWVGSAKFPSLAQQNQDGNEKYETPKNMVGRSLPVRFFYGIFGRPGNQPYQIGKDATLMWPFGAVPADLYAYTFHETRVAAFGPWFSGCLILSLVLGVWILVDPPGSRALLVLMVLTISASVSLSQHLWWARFGPQFWLLAILPMGFVFRHDASGFRLMLARVVLCLLIVNAAIVAGVRLHWDTKASLTLRNQLRQMRDSGSEYDVQTDYFDDSIKVRLREAGIKFRNVGKTPLPDSEELRSVVDGYRHAVRYSATADATPLRTPPSQQPG